MLVNVFIEGIDEFENTVKDAAPESVFSEIPENRSTMFSQEELVGV